MEKKRSYEKPDIKVVSVISKQSVADACWSLDGIDDPSASPGSHGYNGPFYYNIEGPGYVGFYVKHKSNNCNSGPDAYSISYHNCDSSALSEAELENILLGKAANHANNYNAMLKDFPVDPTPMS